MSDILKAKELAYRILILVEERSLYANALMREKLDNTSTKYHPLITDIVYGVLRRKNTLDWYISNFVKVDRLDIRLLTILRMGTYQLLYHSISKPPIVNEAVEMGKSLISRKAGSLINAVLRKITAVDIKPMEKSILYSHPAWLIDKWERELGEEETRRLCERNNNPMTLSFRVNVLKTSITDVEDTLLKSGIVVDRGKFSKNCLMLKEGPLNLILALENEGRIFIQAEPSMVVVEMLELRPGMRVLDGCSGIGGKTTYIAELMKNEGEIVAVDKSKSKLKVLKEIIKRREISIIKCIESPIESLRVEDIGSFDRVLLDVPCSGLGTLSRRPEIKWRLKPKDIIKLSEIQRSILSSGSRFLKPGGILVYSACTISKEETYDIIKSFIDKNREFHVVKEIQFFPHIDEVEGFYIAKLQRNYA
ncbi:MAG: 16S rRNA (cytosine(967)-C(5))-methyltransferase RsmB [bacterium]|nr:16S rRNA (cytosine(967)-C(5))-methyltransferase RsmB [bacterium]